MTNCMDFFWNNSFIDHSQFINNIIFLLICVSEWKKMYCICCDCVSRMKTCSWWTCLLHQYACIGYAERSVCICLHWLPHFSRRKWKQLPIPLTSIMTGDMTEWRYWKYTVKEKLAFTCIVYVYIRVYTNQVNETHLCPLVPHIINKPDD